MSESLLDISSKKCIGGFSSLCLNVIDGNLFGVIVEIVLYFICIVCLQIICHEFLVPSLEILCVKLGLKEDVAGATFIAFGSSAAEIMISIITISHGDDYIDLGIGSIMGAGIIGSLLVPGLCGAVSKKVVEIKKLIVVRDSVFYIACLILLSISLFDGTVYVLECIFLLVIFVVYVIFIVLTPLVRNKFRMKKDAVDILLTKSIVSTEQADSDEDISYVPIDNKSNDKPEEIAVEESFNPVDSVTQSSTITSSVLSRIASSIKKYYDMIFINPCTWVFSHITPHCTHGTKFEYLFPITMIISLIYLFIVAFVLSAVCQRWVVLLEGVGFSASVGSIIGMILVAGVLAIPNLQFSIAMSRRGHGSLGFNNSMSSQILNICIGLGIPLMFSGFSTSGVVIPAAKVVSQSAIMLSVGSIIMIGMTLIPALITKANNCTVDTVKGSILVVIAAIAVVIFCFLALKK